MKPIHGLSLFAIGLSLLLVPASAKNAFRLQMIQQYKMQTTPALTTCQYCHQSSNGGQNFNAFGQTLKPLFDASGDNIKVALYNALKAGKDSDSDGYPDVLEVLAKTAPGDPASKPKQTVAVLQASLKKSGGIDQFKAK